MNKLKSMAATASSKATGMFTSGSGDNLHSVLQKQERKTGAQRRRERSDPFVDGPSFEEVSQQRFRFPSSTSTPLSIPHLRSIPSLPLHYAPHKHSSPQREIPNPYRSLSLRDVLQLRPRSCADATTADSAESAYLDTSRHCKSAGIAAPRHGRALADAH